MKNIIQKIIFSLFSLIAFLGFTSNVFAAPLEATFIPDPLFTEINFLPNDDTSGIVEIKNNTEIKQIIKTEAINITDDFNLSNSLFLTIKEGATSLYSNSLSHFFTTAGEVLLGEINSGDTKTFTYVVTFLDINNNTLQEKTLGFDICVGFEGGNTNCGNTVASEEIDNDNEENNPNLDNNDGGNGGNGGSGGGGPIVLIIFNEQVSSIINNESSANALITWNTNLLSTSQVVYGLTSGGPYVFDLNVLNFGYPFSTVEDPTKVLNHSVLISSLIPGETYTYRVVSRASPPTVSFEHVFKIPIDANDSDLSSFVVNSISDDNSNSSNSNNTNGANSNSGNNNEDLNEDTSLFANNNLAANVIFTDFFGDLISLCTLYGILILILFYLIWRFYFKTKYENNGILKENINKKFSLYFIYISLIVILVAILLKEYCILPIFIITLIIFILKFILNFLNKK